MRESVKFLRYGFLPGDKIEVEWVHSLPGQLNLYRLIVDADYEPEDTLVCVGILRAPWLEHEAGCILVARGGLVYNQRFAISEKPLVSERRLAA